MYVDQFLNEIIPIKNLSLRSAIRETAKIEIVPPNYIFSNMGEKENFVRFLISGTVWGHMYNATGRDVTTCFVTKPGEIIFGSEYLGADYSEITLAAVSACEVFSIPLDVLTELRTQYQEIDDLYLNFLMISLKYHFETKKMLYMKTATERYKWFLMEYPGLIDKVNHAKIASFLNITPVTLSRIRNKY